MKGEPYCLWHSPDHEEEAREARRLGGLRRKREKTVAGAYEVSGLATVEDIRRLLEIAVLDALGLDNSLARARVLIAAAGAALLAGLALLVVALYLIQRRRRSLPYLIPMLFMMISTLAAMAFKLRDFVRQGETILLVVGGPRGPVTGAPSHGAARLVDPDCHRVREVERGLGRVCWYARAHPARRQLVVVVDLGLDVVALSG